MPVYTIKEGINFDKEVALTSGVTYMELRSEALIKASCNITSRTVTTTSINSPFADKGISDNELWQAGFRVQRGSYKENILPMMKYSIRWAADPNTVTEATLLNIAYDAILDIALGIHNNQL
jgi:hypothetical protein